MSSLNKMLLIGFAGSDPEVRQTQGGQSVANFSVATNERWNDKNGDRQERTEWHQLVAWGKLADICHDYVHKGSLVFAEGRLQTREYEDRDGNPRRITEIVVSELRVIGGARNDQTEIDNKTEGPAKKKKVSSNLTGPGSGDETSF